MNKPANHKAPLLEKLKHMEETGKEGGSGWVNTADIILSLNQFQTCWLLALIFFFCFSYAIDMKLAHKWRWKMCSLLWGIFSGGGSTDPFCSQRCSSPAEGASPWCKAFSQASCVRGRFFAYEESAFTSEMNPWDPTQKLIQKARLAREKWNQ